MGKGSTMLERAARPVTPLVLEPVVGPPMATITLDPSRPAVLGRSSACQVLLADESVSRRHAEVRFSNGTWFITDLGSRHGTSVNAIGLTAGGATPLQGGDLVGIGPWTFRVRTGETATSNSHITTDDRLLEQERVERVQEREMAAITQTRLNLLMSCAAAVAGVGDEVKLARAITGAAIEGTGFPRAAVLREVRPSSNEFDVICLRGPGDSAETPGLPASASALRFSTSLINAARSGDVAQVKSDAGIAGGASIISLGIQTAMCAPISIGGTVTAFLYLDARHGESGGARGLLAGFTPGAGGGAAIQQDAAAFCKALAKMYSLAMSNILREQLAARQATIEKELSAAREAQRLIMPPDEGEVGGVRYAMRMRSGRYVAGDLFDVVDISDGGEPRVAVLLGDVAGKGIGAAILMATAQTHLNASLQAHKDPALAVAEVNKYLCTHAAQNKFVSLWLGVIEPRTGKVRFVDAGHGHWLLVGENAAEGTRRIQRVEAVGGLPLGIDEAYRYQAEEFTLGPGERIVVFSDGVIEQPNTDGQFFGLNRAIEALAPSDSEADDVRRLFGAVIEHAQTDSLADDTTVASVGLGRGRA